MGPISDWWKRWSRQSVLPAIKAIGVAIVPNKATDLGSLETQDVAQSSVRDTTDVIIQHRQGDRTSLILAMMLVATLCSGAGVIFMLRSPDKQPSSANPGARKSSPAASASPEATASPSQSVTISPEPSPSSSSPSPKPSRSARKSPTPTRSPAPSGDVTTARVGDCFVDQGTPSRPDMRKVVCASGTLQVLRRFDGTTDMGLCQSQNVTGTTNMYYFYGPSATFVLCMRRR